MIPPVFPFAGGINGDEFFPDEEQEEQMREDQWNDDEDE